MRWLSRCKVTLEGPLGLAGTILVQGNQEQLFEGSTNMKICHGMVSTRNLGLPRANCPEMMAFYLEERIDEMALG